MAADEPRPSGAAASRWSRQVVGPFTLRHFGALVATLATATVLLTVLTTPVGPAAPTTPPRPGSSFVIVGDVTDGLAVGQRAPELEGSRDGVTVPLRDLDGDVIRLADRHGDVVWVNFWASWCPPCQEETPVLRAMHEGYADDGLALVAVSVQETSADDVRAYADTYGLEHTIGFDARSEVFRAWRGFGLPTHVFLDRDGVVRVVHYGPLSLDAATAIVEPLLAEAAPGTTSAPAPSPSASPTG
jgi:thiol-disulfide isomerase/thioredoxin